MLLFVHFRVAYPFDDCIFDVAIFIFQVVSMMLGEIDFDDLYYPYKMVIKPNITKSAIAIEIPQFKNKNFLIPKINSSEDLSSYAFPDFENGSLTGISNFISSLHVTTNVTFSNITNETLLVNEVNGEWLNGSTIFKYQNWTNLIIPSYRVVNEVNGEWLNGSTIFKYQNWTDLILPSYKDFMNLTIPQMDGHSNISLPNLIDADVETSPKPPFYPGTSIILVTIFIILVPVVALNLLVGLAVNDVQVQKLHPVVE